MADVGSPEWEMWGTSWEKCGVTHVRNVGSLEWGMWGHSCVRCGVNRAENLDINELAEEMKGWVVGL